MKIKFKKEATKPAPKVLMSGARFHLLQEMKLSLDENSQPLYNLKFELVTDMNGLQAILGVVQSDGAIVAQVLDGTEESGHDHKPE